MIKHGAKICKKIKPTNIAPICANSPQAKERVERVNKTLQEHLVNLKQVHPIWGCLLVPTRERGNEE